MSPKKRIRTNNVYRGPRPFSLAKNSSKVTPTAPILTPVPPEQADATFATLSTSIVEHTGDPSSLGQMVALPEPIDAVPLTILPSADTIEPLVDKNIILANPRAMKPRESSPEYSDGLIAMDETDSNSEQIGMYLNFHTVDDVDMSTESSRKRKVEDGDECSSHA